MAFLRRPSGRFLVSAAVLVAVAAATGAAGLSAWLIVAIELAAWVVVVLVNRWVSGRLQADANADRPVAPPVAVAPPVVAAAVEPVAVAPVAVVEPPLAGPPEEADRPHEPPAPVIVEEPAPVAPAAATPPTGRPTRWNVWTLETVAKDNASDNDELGFLIVYLREFADSSGELPPGFDSLVRESFGDLLPTSG